MHLTVQTGKQSTVKMSSQYRKIITMPARNAKSCINQDRKLAVLRQGHYCNCKDTTCTADTNNILLSGDT